MSAPSKAELLACLKKVRANLRSWGIEETDVRLQLLGADGWAFHSGDASYDQSSLGAWGASCVRADYVVADLRGVADDLLEQALDDMQATQAEVTP